MPPITTDDKRARAERVYMIVKRHPDGIREAEIADLANIHRRSINNYLGALEKQGKIYKDGLLWFSQAYQPAVLRPLEIAAEEAAALYLAARLFVKQSDRRNEIAETVLYKLAHILHDDVGVGVYIEQAASELSQRPHAPGYVDIFRLVAQSYLYRYQLQIVYQPYRGQSFETTFAPYLLEPSGIGSATYAIGYSTAAGALRTYKVERIQQARLTREEYQIPADFPGLELLRNAWSIYYGEETVKVVLRFHPDVAKRVQETRWHPSQELFWDPHKPQFLCLQVEVADTTDLIPWIRTWGNQCEVLEPLELRDTFMGETRRLAELYGWVNPDNQNTFRDQFNSLWGS